MLNKQRFFTYYKRLLFILLLMHINSGMEAYGQDVSNDQILYDTIVVYDTVWEYETVYDTVWVYDTLFIDTSYVELMKLIPIQISQVRFSSVIDEQKTLLIKDQWIAKVKTNKLRLDYRPKKRTIKKRPNNNYNSASKLTLNPQKGKFDPRLFKFGIYGVELYAGPTLQHNNYENVNVFNDNESNESTTQEMLGFEYGAKFSFNIYQYGAQTGIGLSKINENFAYLETSYLLDSNIMSEEISYWEQRTDTVEFLDVDKLLQGDTVWQTRYYDYEEEVFVDSTYFLYDTSEVNTPKTQINHHYLLEIPLIFSYEIGINRSALLFKFGGVNQIHMFSSGKSYLGNGQVEDINTGTNFTKYNIALYGGLAFVYDVSNQLALCCDVFYKYPFMKFSSAYGTNVNKQTYGLHVGVRYRFKLY